MGHGSPSRRDLHLRIKADLYDLLAAEDAYRRLARIPSTKQEIVEQALRHFLASNISKEAYILMDAVVAQQRAVGIPATRATVMSEAIVFYAHVLAESAALTSALPGGEKNVIVEESNTTEGS
jgi:hypothetical protein